MVFVHLFPDHFASHPIPAIRPSPKLGRLTPPSPASCHPRSTGRPPKGSSWRPWRIASRTCSWLVWKSQETSQNMRNIIYMTIWMCVICINNYNTIYVYIYDVWLYVYVYCACVSACLHSLAYNTEYTVYHRISHNNVWYAFIAIIKKHRSSDFWKSGTDSRSDIDFDLIIYQ